ncbi:unnamed protein product [Anisakis simplex]|uniref:Ubiquitin-conjugating enzyme E2 N (inferred by orthology to a D. melanogaster protein) n=1 Tax=Anisakis simplex TaxID=6269 RepID=A0A0M3K9S1_ANISI|nr:unnamed protein product [Anisakis simplex]
MNLSIKSVSLVCHRLECNTLMSIRTFIAVELSLFCSDKWSPALQIRTVLLSIQALLSAPNPDDPLATDVAEQWKNNESDAIRTAQEWTRVHANGQ